MGGYYLHNTDHKGSKLPFSKGKIALLKTKEFTSIFSNADAEFLVWLCRNQKKFSHKALKVLHRGHKKEVFIQQHSITCGFGTTKPDDARG